MLYLLTRCDDTKCFSETCTRRRCYRKLCSQKMYQMYNNNNNDLFIIRVYIQAVDLYRSFQAFRFQYIILSCGSILLFIMRYIVPRKHR